MISFPRSPSTAACTSPQYCLNIWPASPKEKGWEGGLVWLFVLTYNMIFLFVQPPNKLLLKQGGFFSFNVLFKGTRSNGILNGTKAANSGMCVKKWLPSILPCEEKLFQNSSFPHFPSLLWQNKARTLIFESFSVPCICLCKKDGV